MLTTKVENFPGFADGIMGPDLMAAMRQQAEKLGVEIIEKNATSLSKNPKGELIVTVGGVVRAGSPTSASSESANDAVGRGEAKRQNPENSYSVRAAIIATGASAITLNLPGEDRLMGRGVGTCAVCDAPFYKGKDTVFIIGGGDSAIEEASEISKFASEVIILVRKESLRATPILKKRIEATQNIEIWYKSQALELLGDKRLEKVKINKDGKTAEFPADGLFYAIGHTPATGWLQGSGVELDKKGYIKTDFLKIDNLDVFDLDTSKSREFDQGVNKSSIQDQNFQRSPSSRFSVFPTMTSVSGIFAAGDCVDFRYRQAIMAAGFGAMAALDCQRWLENFLP